MAFVVRDLATSSADNVTLCLSFSFGWSSFTHFKFTCILKTVDLILLID